MACTKCVDFGHVYHLLGKEISSHASFWEKLQKHEMSPASPAREFFAFGLAESNVVFCQV